MCQGHGHRKRAPEKGFLQKGWVLGWVPESAGGRAGRIGRSCSEVLKKEGFWGNGDRVICETFSAGMTRTWC